MRESTSNDLTPSASALTRVLVVEPPSIAGARMLLTAGTRFEVVHAAGVQEAVTWLAGAAADCVVLDLAADPAEALEALARVRAAAADAPVLVLASPEQEGLGARAVAEGAQDHLVHGELDASGLSRAVTYAIQRSRGQAVLAHRALHDPLTGLPNRVLFEDRLRQATARVRRSGTCVAVLFCDLDGFKAVNDTWGHDAGDRLLCAVAERIEGALRTQDTAARLGGDEFAVLCEDVTGTEQAVSVAQRILAELRGAAIAAGVGDGVVARASIGVALAREGTERPEVLLREADVAMYRAKERGGDAVELFDEVMRGRVARRRALQDALGEGLERGEMRIHYQPQVRLATGEVVGVEALVRWQHPDRGLLGPSEFLSVAEETGLIVPLGTWVLREACLQAARWAGVREGLGPLPVAVNLTARQCAQPDLPAVVRGMVDRSGLDPSRLRLEITESAVLTDFHGNLEMLRTLRDIGVSLAIDDFGAGPASLAALQQLPVDVVTVDRSLIAGLRRDGEGAAMLGGIVGLAHALGLSTVAEGVEAIGQVDRLKAMGCDAAQGFFFGRPDRAEALAL